MGGESECWPDVLLERRVTAGPGAVDIVCPEPLSCVHVQQTNKAKQESSSLFFLPSFVLFI